MGAAKKTSLVKLLAFGVLGLAILGTVLILVGGVVKVMFFPAKESAQIEKSWAAGTDAGR